MHPHQLGFVDSVTRTHSLPYAVRLAGPAISGIHGSFLNRNHYCKYPFDLSHYLYSTKIICGQRLRHIGSTPLPPSMHCDSQTQAHCLSFQRTFVYCQVAWNSWKWEFPESISSDGSLHARDLSLFSRSFRVIESCIGSICILWGRLSASSTKHVQVWVLHL